jgi:hypothetical protein
METKPEMNTLIVEDKNVAEPPKKIKKTESKKNMDFVNIDFDIEEDDEIETNIFELIVAIPDCFVSPYLKLSNGKNGHGERRLYTGDNNNNNEYICNKPWFINYPSNYKNEIEELLDDDENFSKNCDDRKSIVYNAIDSCNKKLINISTQNGN